MNLNPKRFNRLINHIGEDCRWRRAFACPCKSPTSGQADPRCPQCSGKSWLWAAGQDGTAAKSGQKAQLQWAQSGLWQAGDVVLTIGEDSPLYDIGPMDRVMLLNSSNPFSTTLLRGAATEHLFGEIQSVDRVFWLDINKAIVEGTARPTVAANGSLTWSTTGSPPSGQQYSISGVRLNEYFCWGDFSQDRMMHHGARLPRKIVLRLFDLFGH